MALTSRSIELLAAGLKLELGAVQPLPPCVAPADAYLAAQIVTASPRRLPILLHDAARGLCHKALEAYDGGQPARAADRLARASRIIGQLGTSLESAPPGEVRKALCAVFEQCAKLLARAEFYRCRENVQDVIRLLGSSQPAWEDLAPAFGEDRPSSVASGPENGWIG